MTDNAYVEAEVEQHEGHIKIGHTEKVEYTVSPPRRVPQDTRQEHAKLSFHSGTIDITLKLDGEAMEDIQNKLQQIEDGWNDAP
jgi:hypothetical protein